MCVRQASKPGVAIHGADKTREVERRKQRKGNEGLEVKGRRQSGKDVRFQINAGELVTKHKTNCR